MEKHKELAALEGQVYRFVELLSEQRAATRENIQRKQAQTGEILSVYFTINYYSNLVIRRKSGTFNQSSITLAKGRMGFLNVFCDFRGREGGR